MLEIMKKEKRKEEKKKKRRGRLGRGAKLASFVQSH